MIHVLIAVSAKVEKQNVCLGTSNFDEIVKSRALLIDKTLFIKEFMDRRTKVDIILRPRRFGKSTNLSMLKSFLSTNSIAETSLTKKFFGNCLIGQYVDFINENFRKYPTILLTLKDCIGDTWEEMKSRLWRCIREMFLPHLAELSATIQFQDFNFRSLVAPTSELLEGSLMLLMEALYGKSGCQVIVLIDEFDTPLNAAFRGGLYDLASQFFASFFTSALKDNYRLKKACLLGIVEVRGASLLSALNNVCVYSVADIPYSSCFGFSVEEIHPIVESEETLSNILEWYNGYTIGTKTVINPWSFLSCIMDGIFRSFWIDTAFTATIKSVLEPQWRDLMLTTFHLLFDPDPVSVPSLCSKVDYSSKSMGVVSVLHFLVHTGYLSYCRKDEFVGIVRIPNYELRHHWNVHVVKMVREKVFHENSVSQNRLQQVFSAEPLSLSNLENVMRDLLYSSLSYYDTISENSYHCFYMGCFKTALDLPKWCVKSNRESGVGRYDIVVVESAKRMIVFELKEATSAANLNAEAERALLQACEKDYAAKLKGYQCYLIGVAFFQKTMSELKLRVNS